MGTYFQIKYQVFGNKLTKTPGNSSCERSVRPPVNQTISAICLHADFLWKRNFIKNAVSHIHHDARVN